jgi:hypothetical protein
MVVLLLHVSTYQYFSYILLVDTKGAAAWRKKKKSEWSSWTAAVVDADTNGCRETASARQYVPNASHHDGTNRKNRLVDIDGTKSLYLSNEKSAQCVYVGHPNWWGRPDLDW